MEALGQASVSLNECTPDIEVKLLPDLQSITNWIRVAARIR